MSPCTRSAGAPSSPPASNPDVVVGMGGGSCLDLAKAVAVILAHGGDGRPTTTASSGCPVPWSPSSPCPPRQGTGSEVTPVAVLTDPERDQQGGHLQSLPDPAHGRLRPGAHGRLPVRRSPRARARTPCRTSSRRSPRSAAGDVRARHRARLRRQERADRHLRPSRGPPDRREPAPRVVRPPTTSRPARR